MGYEYNEFRFQAISGMRFAFFLIYLHVGFAGRLAAMIDELMIDD